MFPSDVIGRFQKLNGTLVTFHESGMLKGLTVTDHEGTIILELEWSSHGTMTSELSGQISCGQFKRSWTPEGKILRDTRVSFKGTGENLATLFPEYNEAGDTDRQFEYDRHGITERTFYPGGKAVLKETTFDSDHRKELRKQMFAPGEK